MARAAWFRQRQSSLLVFVCLVSSAMLMLPTSWRWLSSPSKRHKGAVAHLHLFMHDVLTGPDATAVVVVNGRGPVRFGQVVVMDDVVTAGPSPASAPRARGFYVFSSMGGPTVLFCMNVVLTAGPYSGSTVTITGRDDILEPLWELSVVGGTGRFRMATGYVLWRTASWQIYKNAVIELDVFVHMISPAAAHAC